MDDLPLELTCAILESMDALTMPIMRCVTHQWRDLVDHHLGRVQKGSLGQHKGTDSSHHTRARTLPPTAAAAKARILACCPRACRHDCKRDWKCVSFYAQRLIDRGRWILVHWVLAGADSTPARYAIKQYACLTAATTGDLQYLQELEPYGIGIVCPITVVWKAARHGHLNVLWWLRDHGCSPISVVTCYNAAKHGHLAVLKWAFEIGCPMDALVCHNAALGGHLEVLQWAMANGCPCDSRTAKVATHAGHDHIVEWLTVNGHGRS